MASYRLNRRAVAHARRLIDARQYILDSDWGEVQPTAADENRFLKTHSWVEYATWPMGLTDGATDETKARYAFVFGDFRRVHRSGIIACHFRAAEWRHKEIELAAHRLLQYLDKRTKGATEVEPAVGGLLGYCLYSGGCSPRSLAIVRSMMSIVSATDRPFSSAAAFTSSNMMFDRPIWRWASIQPHVRHMPVNGARTGPIVLGVAHGLRLPECVRLGDGGGSFR